MKQKRVMVSGFAYDDWFSKLFRIGVESDLNKLKELAKDGWIVNKIEGLFYILDNKEQQHVDYAIDYQDQPSNEYLELNEAKGWKKVASLGYIHLFKAKAGTVPLHTSIESKLLILNRERKRFINYSKITLPAFLITALANLLLQPADLFFVAVLLLISLLATSISLIYALFPLIGYTNQLNKLKNRKI